MKKGKKGHTKKSFKQSSPKPFLIGKFNKNSKKPFNRKVDGPSSSKRKAAPIIRSWQKQEQKPITNKEKKGTQTKQRKNNDKLMKIIIVNQLKHASQGNNNLINIPKIKESLSKISSRGLKQRLKNKVTNAGIKFE